MNNPTRHPSEPRQLLRQALNVYEAELCDDSGSTADLICDLGLLWLAAEGATLSGFLQELARGLDFLDLEIAEGPITGDHRTSQEDS